MFLGNPIPDFSTRSKRDEWMEDPDLDYETLAEAVDAVARISRFTGGRQASISGIEQLIEMESGRVSVLDVGTGNGRLSRSLAEWGRPRGLELDVLGIDLLPKAVEAARRHHAHLDNLRFECVDLFELEGERRFDVVHASLVLHHFPGDQARRALDRMAELSRFGVVVNDLHRHPVHWAGSKVVIPMLTRNPIAIHDGPVSVLRGFKRRELIDLGRSSRFAETTVEWRFPFRWLLVGRP